MTWEPELEELRRREAMARELGGVDKVQRQHDGGRLTVRERIDALVDAESFHEIGAIAGKAEYGEDGSLTRLTPSNFVFGRGGGRWAAGGGGGRRFHGPGWVGRRYDPREAHAVGADGETSCGCL